MSEVNYKVEFAKKYFDKTKCEFDVLNQVDIVLKDKKNETLLYIESKYLIANETDVKKALAQTILTNKKQKHILNKVALIYKNQEDDVMHLIDCSDDGIMYNNDINWSAEKPSNPTKDAVDRIWDRIQSRITIYKNDEIKEVYQALLAKGDTKIKIMAKNVNVIYNAWKNSIEFNNPVQNEQDLINLFLVDVLNSTKYKQKVIDGIGETEQQLIREGTYLNKYEIEKTEQKIRIVYNDQIIYAIKDIAKYDNFWNKYQRPPQQEEFLSILERSASLYSDKYRRDTGGEYTPHCFVDKQNEILKQYYNLEEFIVCDTCAGVGNLENQFGIDFKKNCYLSTLEASDVEICKIKGFENTIQYDYLKHKDQPKWKYQGTTVRSIDEICRLENKKLMIIINPPYQRKKGFDNNLAIEFFNKVIKLKPQVIVFYYRTEAFFREEIDSYIASGYKIRSHIMSDASTTFLVSSWPVSQIIFDRDIGDEIDKSAIKIDRYEVSLNKEYLTFIKTYTYNQTRPNLIKEIEKEIKKNQINGLIFGQWCYLTGTIVLGNGGLEKSNKVTSANLKYCLLSKGINFNTHTKYFERNEYCFRGQVKEINEELFNDAITFALFFKQCAFTNKGEQKNYIMPFTSAEFNRHGLACSQNDLNVLRDDEKTLDFGTIPPFDFRLWLKQFNFSHEAQELYRAALQVFVYYHKNNDYKNKNYNDSFYDITNTIMGKDINSFKNLDNDPRMLYRTKTTKGSIGFGRNNVKSVIGSQDLYIFYDFFDKRDALAKKINKQLVDSNLLLWERENVY